LKGAFTDDASRSRGESSCIGVSAELKGRTWDRSEDIDWRVMDVSSVVGIVEEVDERELERIETTWDRNRRRYSIEDGPAVLATPRSAPYTQVRSESYSIT
jgi:hypothetical protein